MGRDKSRPDPIHEDPATEILHPLVLGDPGEDAGRDRHHPSAGVGRVGVAVQEVGADGYEPGAVRPGETPIDPIDRRVHVAEVGESDAVDPLAVHEGADALQSLAPVDVRVEEDAVPPAAGQEATEGSGGATAHESSRVEDVTLVSRHTGPRP